MTDETDAGHAPVSRPWAGIVAYVAATFLLTWIPATLLRGLWAEAGSPFVTRLLASSLLYGVTMGWQPLLAVWLVRRWVEPPGRLDHGLRPSTRKFVVAAAVAPVLLVAVAAGVAWLLGLLNAAPPVGLFAVAEPEIGLREPSFRWVAQLTLAAGATFTLLWLQAFSEELGWRGYFLARLMQRLGAWPGLITHGLIWGLWYAPVFLVGNGDQARSAARSAAFIVTCMFLGVLLGWLRLASRSIVPTTLANTVLTVMAGLPFLLHGTDVGMRGAVFGPPGWLPLALALALLALVGRCRSLVRAPNGDPVESPRDHARILVVVEDLLRVERGSGPRLPN